MMLIEKEDALPLVLQKVKSQLVAAAANPAHAWRFASLATGVPGNLGLRYVVLRAVEGDLRLFFYTDIRTDKVMQISLNAEVAVLFYNPEQRVQLRINGEAKCHHENETSQKHWELVGARSAKAYASVEKPGDAIAQPEAAHDWLEPLDDRYFAVIEVIPFRLDLLQLAGLEHLRARFKKEEDWQGQWVAP